MRTKEVAGMARRELSSDPGNARVKPQGQGGFEMANLRPDRTGLPFVVFISQRGGARHDLWGQSRSHSKSSTVGHDHRRSSPIGAGYKAQAWTAGFGSSPALDRNECTGNN